MSLPIRTLPVVERWDCHGCGICCRGTVVELDADDIARLKSQGWTQHPDYRGQKIVVRRRWWPARYELAKRPDGSCIFLTPQGRCRIHEQFGLEAKPLVCQMFPLQVVPLERFAYLTLRRYCPSAAADRGRTLESHQRMARALIERWQKRPRPAQPPPLVAGYHATWDQVLTITDVLDGLVRDARYPLVRRLAHVVEFCDLLEHCRLDRLDRPRLAELADMLRIAAVRDGGHVFRDRQAPDVRTGRLFRQAVFEYLALHPQFSAEAGWPGRFRLLGEAAAFHRGTGRVPRRGLPFAETTFEALERPIGALDAPTLRPLEALFEASAASLRFAMLGRRRWPLTHSARALVLGHPVAMWTLRLACSPGPPAETDMLQAVAMLDRGETYPPFTGRRHQIRLAAMARAGGLARLLAWYGR
mgnify:CR=1 FL=1